MIPLAFLYYYNDPSHRSVSSVICLKRCKPPMLICSFLIGLFAFQYETDYLMKIALSAMIVCLYGLIIIDETYTLHKIFALIVFAAIMVIMVKFALRKNIVILAIIVQIIAAIHGIINYKTNIFWEECVYIGIYIITYLGFLYNQHFRVIDSK